ncbi:NusG domain II-containing protein [bacterium]
MTAWDKRLILILAGISLFFMALNYYRHIVIPKHNKKVGIYINGQKKDSFPLSLDRVKTYKLADENFITLQIKNNKVRVKQSSCPHKICVKSGWIKKVGLGVVCLPNKCAVEIEGHSKDQDAITY